MSNKYIEEKIKEFDEEFSLAIFYREGGKKEVRDFLRQALTQTHNNALKVAVDELEALRYAVGEAGGKVALVDVAIKNINSKKA